MQKEYIDIVASAEVQEFIRQHEHDNPQKIVLQQKAIYGVPAGILADQIAGRKKARIKLPSFYGSTGIVYPAGLNFEQSSSETTAGFKAKWIRKYSDGAKVIIDLTGGFGVDSLFLSRTFDHVIYVEPNAHLLKVAQHNHRILGAYNIEYADLDAEKFLDNFRSSADAIYVDPSRRDEANRKMVGFSDCVPNVLALKTHMMQSARNVFVKAAPLLDIKAGMESLGTVKSVKVLAVDNECKELLFHVADVQERFDEIPISTVNLSNSYEEVFDFRLADERLAIIQMSRPLKYLYEPNVAILKAGAFKRIAQVFQVHKLDSSTHLYTSETLERDFPGRIFEVDSIIDSDPKEAARRFTDRKANIITRNYPLSVHDLSKKLKLTEGGDNYLIGATAVGKKILIHARRLK